MRLTGGLYPLRVPAYRQIWFSSLAGAGAQWMERVLTGWLTLQVGGDAYAVGLVLAVRMVPFVLFGLVAGTIADRFPRRTCLIIVSICAAVFSILLGVVVRSGGIELWHILVLSLFGGAVFVFDMPARSALVVDLVGAEHASAAIALNSVALRAFGAVGAFVGGVLIAQIGLGSGYFVVAAVYLTSFALLITMRGVPERRAHAPGPRVSFPRAVSESARLIVDYPTIRMVIVVSLAAEMFGYSYQSAMPTVARDVLALGPEGLGTLTAGASIGSTIAVVLLTLVPGSVPRQPLLTLSLAVWGGALIALGSSRIFEVSLAAMLFVGGCASAIDALQQTVAQTAVPEHQRGRAVGAWVFSIGANLIGLYQVGYVAALIGAPTTLVINGLGAGLCAAALLMFAPTFRWRRAEPAGASAGSAS